MKTAQLSQLKRTIHQRLADEFQHVVPSALIRRALDDAEQLAHSTGFPLLVFPVLAEESVRRVSEFLGEETEIASALASVAA